MQPTNNIVAAIHRTVQWDGEEMPKPVISTIDEDIYVKSAKEKQRYLEKQISDLPIDANWKAGLQHALSKMGMFYNDAYLDLKESVRKVADIKEKKE